MLAGVCSREVGRHWLLSVKHILVARLGCVLLSAVPRIRGVQYVRKCIMVKVGGKRITHKVCNKKQVNFSKTEGKILQSRGEIIIIFAKNGGNALKEGNRGILNSWSMTKK